MSLVLFILSLSVLSCSHAEFPDIDLRTDVRMRDVTTQRARTLPAQHQEPYSPHATGRNRGINNISDDLGSIIFFHRDRSSSSGVTAIPNSTAVVFRSW
jgi:hypothetical protein